MRSALNADAPDMGPGTDGSSDATAKVNLSSEVGALEAIAGNSHRRSSVSCLLMRFWLATSALPSVPL